MVRRRYAIIDTSEANIHDALENASSKTCSFYAHDFAPESEKDFLPCSDTRLENASCNQGVDIQSIESDTLELADSLSRTSCTQYAQH